MQKDFSEWHRLKIRLQEFKSNAFFRERDIWLFSIGMNLGHEEDGKGQRLLRPVIIFKKFNADLFWGIPLTKAFLTGSYYYNFPFAGRLATALLPQMRLFDRKRLVREMGIMPDQQFEELKTKLNNLAL